MFGSKLWWKAAGRRAVKTFAQSVVSAGVVIGSVSAATDWVSAGWTIATILITAAGAAVLSLFNSLAGLPELQCEGDEPMGD
jgi:hypothetical protein